MLRIFAGTEWRVPKGRREDAFYRRVVQKVAEGRLSYEMSWRVNVTNRKEKKNEERMNRKVLGGAPLDLLHRPSMSVMLLCLIGLGRLHWGQHASRCSPQALRLHLLCFSCIAGQSCLEYTGLRAYAMYHWWRKAVVRVCHCNSEEVNGGRIRYINAMVLS